MFSAWALPAPPTPSAPVPDPPDAAGQSGIPADRATEAFFLHDLQGRLLDCNQQACDMLGYTRDELLHLTAPDISVEHDLLSAQVIWRGIHPGNTVTIPGHQRRRNGSTFPTETRLSGLQVMGQTLILALVRDLSERTRAEQLARESRDRYRLLFESIDEGFCVIQMLYDDHGKPVDYLFLEVNPAFEKQVGLLGAVGRSIRELVPHLESKWIEIYHQVAATGLPSRFVEQSSALGRSFDVYAFPVGQPGQPHVAVLFTDITGRLAAEKALIKSEKLALVGLLTGVISHEIRNPLEAIDNLLYMAADESNVTTIHDYIRIANGELKRVADIVTHTLHFNRQSDTPATERLSDLLESATTVYEARIRQSGVKLHCDFHPGDTISCLASELRQVFINFVVNAFEATPAGGVVSLRTYPSHNWKTGEPGVRVTVADTGHGMDPNTRKRLFEAFYTTKGSQGTGLGLWVSREILHRHAAHVCVRSRQAPGRSGTAFHLWFPLTPPPHAPIRTM